MTSDLTKEEKLVLIGQLYASQLQGLFIVKEDKRKATYLGQVTELSPKETTIKIADGYQLLQVENIFTKTNYNLIISQTPILGLKRISTAIQL